jgi:hypothetical protein
LEWGFDGRDGPVTRTTVGDIVVGVVGVFDCMVVLLVMVCIAVSMDSLVVLFKAFSF